MTSSASVFKRQNTRFAFRALAPAAVAVLTAVSALAAEDPAQERILLGQNALDMFVRGGPLMWPILLCSVVALAFVFERIVALRRRAVFPAGLHRQVRRMLSEGHRAEALELCAGSRSSFGRLLHACLIRFDAPGFEMEAALEEAGSRELYDLRKNARPLGVVADVAPLLGLMGTVVGMIKAFEVVARTGALGRTELLAEGIGEALVTTAFGLSVAVPCLILNHYFRGKADDLLRSMEDACIEILNDLRRRQGERP